jgi:hypothetical protein
VDAASKLSLTSLGVSRPPGAISKPRRANKAYYTKIRPPAAERIFMCAVRVNDNAE